MESNISLLEMTIVYLQDLRWNAKSKEVKRLASDRIEYLRGELMLQKAKEAQAKNASFRDTRPRYEIVCQAHESLDCEICG